MKSEARMMRIVLALVCATVAVVFCARIFGPSDLYQNHDQSKTASFTADIVLNGRWALPIDMTGARTRKPPLYNWIGAPFFAAGWHSEFALKFPSVLAGLATVVLTFFAARRLFGVKEPALAYATAALWIAAPENAKHIYFCRPDIVLIALLTGGWLCAMRALDTRPGKARAWVLAAMWAITGLAAITKGPAAVLIPMYALLHSAWIGVRDAEGEMQRGRKWAARIGWWGMPIVLAIVAAWLIPAYLADPDYVREGLLGREMAGRLDASKGAGTIVERLAAHSRPIRFFFERFAPWSALCAAALFMLGPIKRVREHPLAPTLLWVLMVLGVMTLLAGKGGSYIAPAYPAAAILAVHGFTVLLAAFKVSKAKTPVIIAACALLVGTSIGTREMFFSRGARTETGDAIVAFSRGAERIVGSDAVVFADLGYVPIPTLMGQHQVGPATEDEIGAAHWVIMPVRDSLPEPVLVSDELKRLRAQDGGVRGGVIHIGLWPIETVRDDIRGTIGDKLP